MKLRIDANTALTRRFLEVDEIGVTFFESAGLGGTRDNIAYDDIDAVLRSSDSVLSIQVGRTIYKLPIQDAKKEHRAAVEMLLNGCRNPIRRPA